MQISVKMGGRDGVMLIKQVETEGGVWFYALTLKY